MRHPSEDEHPAVRAARDVRAIVDAWPDLTDALGGGGRAHGARVSGTQDRGLVINVGVSQVMSSVAEWAWFLARVLCDETTWVPPEDHTPPSLLSAIALRVGHFTEHEDELLAQSFLDDAAAMRAKVEATAYPSGARWVKVGVPCQDHGTDDHGARVPCQGEYRVRLVPDMAWIGDMICNADRGHTLTPADWQAGQRRMGRGDPDAARRMLEAISGMVGA